MTGFVLSHRIPRWVAGVGAPVLAVALALPGHTGSASSRSAPPSTEQARERHIDRAVQALIGRMTLAEKFGQLEMALPTGPDGTPGSQLLDEVRKGQVGSVLDLTKVANINTLQRAALQSRLHIPIIAALDVIHGYSTVFPVPLGESTSWDPAAVRKDAAVSAHEATADGIKWTFNPMVDIARDPRWGRIVEGSGEDPYLGSVLAAAKVRGYQGSDYSGIDKMATTVKHFAAYGAAEAGREYNDVDMSDERLRNDYLPPYHGAVAAGAASVMPSFNDLNGVPSTGNSYLLGSILRKEWGFRGVTVSDYTAVQELVAHGFAPNEAQAARLALSAGTDVEMVSTTYGANGPQLVRSGQLSIARVDQAVGHVLRLKYLAGMFAHPFTDPTRVTHDEYTPANLAVSRHMADESLVLLRNQGHALPLAKSTGSIAVVGPLSDDNLNIQGGSSWGGKTAVSVRAGITAAVPDATVHYAQGCDTTCGSAAGFGAAVAAAHASDVTVVVVGEPASDSGEASSRSNIDLPGKQLDLVKAIAATGKPYVVVLMNGRPLTIDWLAHHAPALLEAWFPGSEGGNAVADVLFGAVNPSGKLTTTFPRSVGQIPLYYDERPTGRPFDPDNKYTSKYLDISNTPEYPFGYGLSYTKFALSGLHLSAAGIGRAGTIRARATLTNTGPVAGDDVVQLYIHDLYAQPDQPVRRLRGFQRVSLQPGRSTTVSFTLGPRDLGFWDNTGHFGVQSGPFDVYVGDSSVGGLRARFSVG